MLRNLVLLGLAVAHLSCSGPEKPRPNVIWIVWDTVRSDHLSLYGHPRKTTPHLEAWAEQARVFEDCLSAAGNTVPSHASMFTGLLPSEHCAHNGHRWLDDEYTTIAELLQAEGYQTFAFSSNPHVSKQRNLTQGFDSVEHPWRSGYRRRATQLVRDKLSLEGRSSELRSFTARELTAAGALAEQAMLDWLATIDGQKPFFAFLNYMEAHQPLIPPRSFRARLMSTEEVERSYEVDRSWTSLWEYTFDLRDYSEQEIELTRATYDATLLELDELFHDLMTNLEGAGYLEDTIVILTSDHGEHLGEQHMLDHQYSVYQALLRVPLIVWYPPAVPPGRDPRPVMNFDLFPTLLGLTGIRPPDDLPSRAVDLLQPEVNRVRFAEDPAHSETAVQHVLQRRPDWDPTPWRRGLRSMVRDRYKYIRGTDGRTELFDLNTDPLESSNLLDREGDLAAKMQVDLEDYYGALRRCETTERPDPTPTREQLETLKSLGYVN
jgi:arylsulfatase A-like enzyme